MFWTFYMANISCFQLSASAGLSLSVLCGRRPADFAVPMSVRNGRRKSGHNLVVAATGMMAAGLGLVGVNIAAAREMLFRVRQCVFLFRSYNEEKLCCWAI